MAAWFISPKYRRHSALPLAAFALAFVVIMLGAFTRLTDAGLSCPDWPHCYGFITAPHTTQQIQEAMAKYPATPVEVKKAWTEMVHRYFAGTEGILILLLAGSIFFARKAKDLKSVTIGIALISLLAVQVLLGMLTVTEKLKPIIVTSHLLTGISILSVLWWAYLDLHLRYDRFAQHNHQRIIPWLWIAFIVVALQISLGGWVSTHFAALACVDFPYCNGKLIPAMQWNHLNSDLISIHMLHRFGAVVTASYMMVLTLYLFTKPAFRIIAITLFAILCTQVTLGILNIVWLRPVWVAVIHQAVGILLLLTTMTALVKAYCESRDTRHGKCLS